MEINGINNFIVIGLTFSDQEIYLSVGSVVGKVSGVVNILR